MELLFICSPVQGWTTMDTKVSFQLSECRKVQTTLHANVLLTFFMLELVSTKFTGVRKASTTHTATGGRKTTLLIKK